MIVQSCIFKQAYNVTEHELEIRYFNDIYSDQNSTGRYVSFQVRGTRFDLRWWHDLPNPLIWINPHGHCGSRANQLCTPQTYLKLAKGRQKKTSLTKPVTNFPGYCAYYRLANRLPVIGFVFSVFRHLKLNFCLSFLWRCLFRCEITKKNTLRAPTCHGTVHLLFCIASEYAALVEQNVQNIHGGRVTWRHSSRYRDREWTRRYQIAPDTSGFTTKKILKIFETKLNFTKITVIYELVASFDCGVGYDHHSLATSGTVSYAI